MNELFSPGEPHPTEISFLTVLKWQHSLKWNRTHCTPLTGLFEKATVRFSLIWTIVLEGRISNQVTDQYSSVNIRTENKASACMAKCHEVSAGQTGTTIAAIVNVIFYFKILLNFLNDTMQRVQYLYSTVFLLLLFKKLANVEFIKFKMF